MSRYIDADKLLDDIIKRYCENCERRKGMKRGKLRIIYEIGDAPCRACEIDDMKTKLEDAPTAEVAEVKHGRWEDSWRLSFDGTKYWYRECSVCGHERNDDNIDKDTPYCPNCGSRMVDEVGE